MKITNLIFHSNLPGANELMESYGKPVCEATAAEGDITLASIMLKGYENPKSPKQSAYF